MTNKLTAALLLTISTLCIPAQTPTQPQSLTGRWLISSDYFGTPVFFPLKLDQQGSKLTGVFRGEKLEGTFSGNALHFIGKDSDSNTNEVTGTIQNGVLDATEVDVQFTDKSHPLTLHIMGSLAPQMKHSSPQRHEFTPTVFYRALSALNKPVLTISPGDTIHTTTVDAAGTDFQGIKRSLGGNPQTGPFYITGAMPGDTLVVHIVRLKLNRDYAISDDNIVERGLNSALAVQAKDLGKDIRWHLDTAAGTATPDPASAHLAHYTVPLKPMLGCISTAPGISQAAPNTGDSGYYGGNMDFNEVTEGSTVYLQVSNPGALLYFGDAHAAQGDGELNGNALETSMDVELTVDVIPNKQVGGRRIETPTAIIAMGLQGSLDEAFKEATDNMARWLTEDYKLSPSEVAQVIGTAAEYHVSEVADRNAGIVLKIGKDRLRTLTSIPDPPAPKTP